MLYYGIISIKQQVPGIELKRLDIKFTYWFGVGIPIITTRSEGGHNKIIGGLHSKMNRFVLTRALM